ncbi:MAG TPA: EthD family reductase [Bryobacteraceae bacterium]|nr:EthD family reductase [Bryobacteraceae bacterium]
MVKVSVLYPYKEGGRFDMDYYMKSHIPMVQRKLGTACKEVTVEQGISGADPATKPAYTLTAHMLFDSADAFRAAFGPHAAEILADIANYTEIQPVVQVSDVIL